MTDERIYSPRYSGEKKLSDPRRSFVEMIEMNNRNSFVVDGSTKNETSIELVPSEVYSAEDAIYRVGFGNFQLKLMLLSGFVWMAKGFDSVLNLFISSLITCKWNLLRWHSALILTITTIFSIFGCICYGMWADKYGRRTALCSSLIFVFVFGAVSAGLPSYTWFLVFRVVAAFAAGGFPQALTLSCEYMPGPQRGRAVFVLSGFYGVGVLLMLGVLYSAVQFQHWRLFCAVAAVPSGVAMIMMKFFPESIRFLLLSGEYFAANAIAEEMASANRRHLPKGTLYACAAGKRGRMGRLMATKTTILFCCIGLASSIAYYSLDATTDHITRGVVENSTSSNFLGDVFRPVHCLHNMTEDKFIEITWTKALDFPSFVIFLIVVDVVDRKPLLFASCTISSLFIFLLFVPTENVLMSTSFLFCARTLLVGQSDMILLMASEAYPTTERGTAVGMQAAVAYLGYFVSPYIVQGFLDVELKYLIGFSGIIMLLSGIASALLPCETRRQELMEVSRAT